VTFLDLAPADPLIVSVDQNGGTRRSVRRSSAHRAPGVLHLAVSLQVVDERDGRWLLQRRAAGKQLFAGRWTNTCCTHPAPEEDVADAAIRRARQEMGLAVTVTSAGMFTYRAVDTASGLVEYEADYVFVALADTSTVEVDPDEITDLARLPLLEALKLVGSRAGTPWAGEVLRRSFEALNRVR
jgi:isopentenyl-diphosphate delta-isomerase